MANIKNGQLRVVRLTIASAFAELITPVNADGTPKTNSAGKPQMWYTVNTIQPHPTTGECVVWLTQGNATKLAKSVGAVNPAMLGNAIAQAFEECYIDVVIKYCEVGGNITDDDGNDKLDDDGDSIGQYEGDANGQSYWQEVSRKFAIVLSEDAAEYIAAINKELDLEDAREQRNADKAKIKKLKSSTGVASVIVEKAAKAETEEEEEEDEDGDDLVGNTTPPTLTKKQMKAANTKARNAGQPEPYSAAQIAAAQ